MIKNTATHLKFSKNRLNVIKGGSTGAFFVIGRKGSQDVIVHFDKAARVKEFKSPKKIYAILKRTRAFKPEEYTAFFEDCSQLVSIAGIVNYDEVHEAWRFNRTVVGRGTKKTLKDGLRYAPFKGIVKNYTLDDTREAEGDAVDTNDIDQLNSTLGIDIAGDFTAIRRVITVDTLLTMKFSSTTELDDFMLKLEAMIPVVERQTALAFDGPHEVYSRLNNMKTNLSSLLSRLQEVVAELDALIDEDTVDGIDIALDELVNSTEDAGLEDLEILNSRLQDEREEANRKAFVEALQSTELDKIKRNNIGGTIARMFTQGRRIIAMSSGRFRFYDRTIIPNVGLLQIRKKETIADQRQYDVEGVSEQLIPTNANTATGRFHKSDSGKKIMFKTASGTMTVAGIKRILATAGVSNIEEVYIVDSFDTSSKRTQSNQSARQAQFQTLKRQADARVAYERARSAAQENLTGMTMSAALSDAVVKELFYQFLKTEEFTSNELIFFAVADGILGSGPAISLEEVTATMNEDFFNTYVSISSSTKANMASRERTIISGFADCGVFSVDAISHNNLAAIQGQFSNATLTTSTAQEYFRTGYKAAIETVYGQLSGNFTRFQQQKMDVYLDKVCPLPIALQ